MGGSAGSHHRAAVFIPIGRMARFRYNEVNETAWDPDLWRAVINTEGHASLT